MKENLTISALICTIFLHYLIYSENRIEMLKQNVTLSETARRIESEAVRDLIHTNQMLVQEKEAIGVKSYVAGVTASQQDKHYEKVWHEGYDRGSEVQMLVDKSKNAEGLGF